MVVGKLDTDVVLEQSSGLLAGLIKSGNLLLRNNLARTLIRCYAPLIYSYSADGYTI